MDSDSQGMEAMDTSGGGQQQLVYVSEDGTSYIYPTDQTAGGSTEGLVTYIYGGDGDATGTVGEGAVGDGDVQYLLVSADEASGITQQQQHQFIMLPQSVGESSAGTTVVTETKKPAGIQSPSKLTTPVSVLLSPPSMAASSASKQSHATTAEVKVKGGTARVTILPAASKSSGTTSAPTTTIPIRIVSSSVSTTQTISIPIKSSPKVTVSVKASPSKLPPAIVSLPKISVIPAATTTVSSPAAKKLGRPRKELTATATTTTAAAGAAAAPATPAKDALHQLTKPGGVTKPTTGKTPNVIVVPIQISKEMIAAKQSTLKTPAAAASGAAGSSDSEKATKTPKGNVKAEAAKVAVKETPKGKKLKEDKSEHKLEHSPPPLPTRRSKRESNLSMKLAEWGLLPSSGSRHAATDDDDVDDESEDDEEEEEEEEEDEDEIPLIKTVVKTPSSTHAAAAAPKKVVTIAKETKETKEVKETKDKETKDKETKDKETKEVKETIKETKETKETKDGKETKEASKESNIELAAKEKEPAKDAEKPSSPATAGTQTPTATKTVTIVKATPSTSAAVSKATAATPVTTTIVKATPAAAKATPSAAKATPSAAKATPAAGSKATPASGIVKKTSTATPAPKLLQNKSLMCKPIMMTKATSCNPIRITKSTQTDEDGDMYIGTSGAKNVVPVPVPIFVPTPMSMFSLPTPYPVPVPLPIPVPCLVPTTRNSIAAIMKQLQELHDSLPSDPFEADMLKMAEAVAEASEDPDCQPAPELIDRKGNILMQSAAAAAATVAGSTDGPVDVLEMAMRMASETEHNGKDMQSTNTSDSVSLPGGSSGAPAAKRARLTIDSSPAGMDESLPAPLMVVEPLRGPTPTPIVRAPINDSHMRLKYSYGLNAWKQWVAAKNTEIEAAAASGPASLRATSRPAAKLLKTEILQCSPDELNGALSLFVREVRKPTGQTYAPDSIYYLCLGIQHYLFENGRVDNIFTDVYYERFTDNLHELLSAYEVRLNTQGMIVCRVSEEHLWEARLLGAHSPRVLLNTLVYFNTKYFMLQSTETHLSLSFSNILKQWKKNNSLDGKPIRSVYLRYNTVGYSPVQQGTAGSSLDAHRRRTLDPTPYEQLENIDNPLRCPVKLYEFYLSKCPESIRNRNDVFYLTPEPSCVPDSPVWYSAQPLSTEAMNKMLCRIRVVREIQETQLNQAPA